MCFYSYGDFMASSILSRIDEHHFQDCFFAASFSDSGSNCVLAKGILTPDDAEPCFNHMMKNVIDSVMGSESSEGTFVSGCQDLKTVSLIIAHIRSASNVRQAFVSAARDLEEDELEFVQANLTRWEGRVSALNRFLCCAISWCCCEILHWLHLFVKPRFFFFFFFKKKTHVFYFLEPLGT
jgi:hypothetical protein